jgi:putative membrane protein
MRAMVPRLWRISQWGAALALVLVCAGSGWAAYHVPLPIDLFRTVSTVSVLALFGVTAYAMGRTWGIVRGLALFCVLAVYAFAIESVGVLTGFPYGSFQYVGAMAHEVFGLVPWTLPFAWIPIMVGVASLTQRLGCSSWRKRIFVGAVLAMLADMVLDPGAVALGFWRYQAGGWYYAVPWTNFAGWVLTSFVPMALLTRGERVLSCWSMAALGLMLVFWMGVNAGAAQWIPVSVGVVFVTALTWAGQRTHVPDAATR